MNIYRAGEVKLRELQTNRSLNEVLRAAELAGVRKMLKNQLANWKGTINEKVQFLEHDAQNSIDLIFERPISNNIYTK